MVVHRNENEKNQCAIVIINKWKNTTKKSLAYITYITISIFKDAIFHNFQKKSEKVMSKSFGMIVWNRISSNAQKSILELTPSVNCVLFQLLDRTSLANICRIMWF